MRERKIHVSEALTHLSGTPPHVYLSLPHLRLTLPHLREAQTQVQELPTYEGEAISPVKTNRLCAVGKATLSREGRVERYVFTHTEKLKAVAISFSNRLIAF